MNTGRRTLAFCFAINLLLVAAGVAHGLIRTGNPSRYFGEGRWTTGVSCLQLLATAYFSLRVYLCRRAAVPGRGPWLWLLIAGGFVFLAADDAFQIHERLDDLAHRMFQLKGTGMTDRIDDAIIGVYAIIGLLFLWGFRRELMQFPKMLKALGVGCVCAFLSIACDTLSNRPDFFFWLTGNMPLAQKLEGWFAVGDGGFQLLAIGCFMAALYLAWHQASSTAPGGAPGPGPSIQASAEAPLR